MYELCTGYENDYTGLCTSWELWTIMAKLWASSTVIEDNEVFFKNKKPRHNTAINCP